MLLLNGSRVEHSRSLLSTQLCDMLSAPEVYSQGSWIGQQRHTVNGLLPSSCLNGTEPPFVVSPDKRDIVLETKMCMTYQNPCFGPPDADKIRRVFSTQLQSLNWRWSPKHRDCHFSAINQMRSAATWVAWAHTVEAKFGTTLFVGDDILEQLFFAWQTTSGGASSYFHRADVLVNSWTLSPMDEGDLRDCERGALGLPCPPDVAPVPEIDQAGNLGLDNSHHAFPSQEWTRRLAALSPQTLIIGTGSKWWREMHYPSYPSSCRESDRGAGPVHATEVDAFTPFILSFEASCPVFDFKYRLMAQKVLQFLRNAGWSGTLILVTTPAELPDCRAATSPSTNSRKADFPNIDPKATGLNPIAGSYEKLRSLETTAWAEAARQQSTDQFIDLRILDIAELSNQRADLRVPGMA